MQTEFVVSSNIQNKLYEDMSDVHYALFSVVRSAVHRAVDNAVINTVYSAVYSAVESAVGSAVRSAVSSAVYNDVDSAEYSPQEINLVKSLL